MDGVAGRPRLSRRRRRSVAAGAVAALAPERPGAVRDVPGGDRAHGDAARRRAPGAGAGDRPRGVDRRRDLRRQASAATRVPPWWDCAARSRSRSRSRAGRSRSSSASRSTRSAPTTDCSRSPRTSAASWGGCSRACRPSRRYASPRAGSGRSRSRPTTRSSPPIPRGGSSLSTRPRERMFGFDGERVVGLPLSFLMPERFRPMHDAGVRRVAERPESSRIIGKTVEVVGLRADGAEFPIELSLSTWQTGGQRFFGGIIRDIASRKEAEDQARVLETAPDPIVKVDAARRIVLANARTEQLFGYARSELIGRPVEDLFAAHSSRRAADRFHAVGVDADGADAPERGGRAHRPAQGRQRVRGRRDAQRRARQWRHRRDEHPARRHRAAALRVPAAASRRPRPPHRALQPAPVRGGARRARHRSTAAKAPSSCSTSTASSTSTTSTATAPATRSCG